jgi:hypothetical protein
VSVKVRLEAMVEKVQKEGLQQLSKITGASLAWHLRRALGEYLKKGTTGRVLASE